MTRLSIKLLLSIFSFCLVVSCQNSAESSSTAKDDNTNDEPGMYTYGNGTGGLYTITKDSVLFDPVSVVLKSKETYDSGKAARVGLSKSQHSELKGILDKALEDKSSHVEKRTKNSSAIALFRPGQPRKKCLLGPGSGAQLDIDNALKKLTSQE